MNQNATERVCQKFSRASTRQSVVSSTPIINEDQRGRLKDGSDGNHKITRPVDNGVDCRNSPNAGEPVHRVYYLAYDGNNSNCTTNGTRVVRVRMGLG